MAVGGVQYNPRCAQDCRWAPGRQRLYPLRGHPLRCGPARLVHRRNGGAGLEQAAGRASPLRARQGREHLGDHRSPADLRCGRLDHLRGDPQAAGARAAADGALGCSRHGSISPGQRCRLIPPLPRGPRYRFPGAHRRRVAPSDGRMDLPGGRPGDARHQCRRVACPQPRPHLGRPGDRHRGRPDDLEGRLRSDRAVIAGSGRHQPTRR